MAIIESEKWREIILSGYRVLDLTDEKGMLCGKILGDLGADVIKIEKPGGDSARNIGPFYHDVPHPEKSLFWFAYNTSKRGITLNIETIDGREIFKRLSKTADFVVESFPPGYLDSLGLGYSVLSDINPAIIMASITPFGQEGPYKNYKASDLVLEAMAGTLYIKGDSDRPPLRFSVEQAYPQAGAQAAVGMLMANYYRELTGDGQHVDVPIRECLMATLFNVNAFWWMNKTISKRQGMFEFRTLFGGGPWLRWPLLFDCKDGQVAWQLHTGPMGHFTAALVEWMDSEGMSGHLKDVDWGGIDATKVTEEQQMAWLSTVSQFLLTYTKSELYEEGRKRGLLLYPVSTSSDILDNPQLEARDFWMVVKHHELGTSITYPGAPFKSTEEMWRISRRAPLIGEHNSEIYEGQLGFSKQDLCMLKQHNVI